MVRHATSLITRAAAREYLEQFRLVDPRGTDSVRSVVDRCTCFALDTQPVRSVAAVRITDKSTLWIDAAAGSDHRAVFDAIDLVAANSGLTRIGFQTARRGLVRIAQSLGYVLADSFGSGWTLYKATP